MDMLSMYRATSQMISEGVLREGMSILQTTIVLAKLIVPRCYRD